MRLLKLAGYSDSRLHDPDGGGATGDPVDPDNPDGAGGGGTSDEKPDKDAALRDVAATIREAIAAARVPATPVVAIPAAPAGPSDALIRELEAESATVNAKINELANSGDVAGAFVVRDQFNAKVARLTAAPQADNTLVKTAVAVGERLARSENKDLFKRWGTEIRDIVNSMPLDERVQPDAWDKAVTRVKSNHIDELIAESSAAAVAEARKGFVPPPSAPGSRGARRLDGAASKLSEEQLWAADLCGVSPDEYAKSVAAEQAYDALPFKERGPFPGYPVVETHVQPGKF